MNSINEYFFFKYITNFKVEKCMLRNQMKIFVSTFEVYDCFLYSLYPIRFEISFRHFDKVWREFSDNIFFINDHFAHVCYKCVFFFYIFLWNSGRNILLKQFPRFGFSEFVTPTGKSIEWHCRDVY